jgi:hypothetical protein
MSKAEKLKVTRVPVARLARRHIEDMWQLYETYYENVDRARFERDLREKQCVFLGIERSSGRVRAFSTARFYTVRHARRKVGVYFSGDTMVHPEYWGGHVLQRRVVPALLLWRLRRPFRRAYWHLTCNGYRTFLTLANSFPEYWPHPDTALPEWERGLIDRISRGQFGSAWHPREGVVRDDARLKAGVAPLTSEVRAIPAVRFFLRRNPGYRQGDELSMVGRIDRRFFLRVGRKLLPRRRVPRATRSRDRVPRRVGAGRPLQPAASRASVAASQMEQRSR